MCKIVKRRTSNKFSYESALGEADHVIARDFLHMKEGVTCVITADTKNGIKAVQGKVTL